MAACHTNRCVQGRQPCPTPYVCSGRPACNVNTANGGATIEDGLPVTMHETRGMAVSRWVWASAVACGLLYAAAYRWLT